MTPANRITLSNLVQNDALTKEKINVMFKLKTERLLLRDFHEEDLIPYQNFGNHPAALTYYPQNREEWAAHAAELVPRFIKASQDDPRTSFTLAISANGTFAGVVSVRLESHTHRQGSIGCGLVYEYWGKGYALEAMQATLDLGFEKLNCHRIYAETISENKAAITLAQRLGMQIEGELRENQYFKGKWWGTTILGILRAEWQSGSVFFQ